MGKKIRGVSMKRYAEIMHAIERGETTEREMVRKGELAPSKRDGNQGIAKFRDNQVFKKKSKARGRRSHEDECLVPHCNNDSSRRGLCNTHRTYAYLLIKKKKASEADLIKRNLLLPKASGGDQRSELAKRRQAQEKRMKADRKKKRSIVKKKRANGQQKKKSKSLKKSSRQPIPEKFITSNRCLYPKCKTSRKGGSRGLCSKHYSQYKRKKAKLSARKQKMLDRDLIDRNLLLPPMAKIKKIAREPESDAFELGSDIRGSIRRW